MPPLIARARDCPPLDWAGFLAALTASGFAPDDPASVAHLGRLLGGLWHDRGFLADHVAAAIEADEDGPGSDAPHQTLLLASGAGWYVRAAFWPAPHDWLFRRHGPAMLQYGVVHDHNFPFLTLGYAGPGYASDLWTRAAGACAGIAGEAARLTPLGRMQLCDGDVRHYRAEVDVHSQRPPDRFSISVNIVATDPADGWREQYHYDPAGTRIAGTLHRMGAARLLELATAVRPDLLLPLAERLARDHPHPRMRLTAYRTLARQRPGTATELRAAARDDDHPLVREGADRDFAG